MMQVVFLANRKSNVLITFTQFYSPESAIFSRYHYCFRFRKSPDPTGAGIIVLASSAMTRGIFLRE